MFTNTTRCVPREISARDCGPTVRLTAGPTIAMCHQPTSPPASSPSSQIITVSQSPTQSPPTPPSLTTPHHTAAQWSQWGWPAQPGSTSLGPRDTVRWRGWLTSTYHPAQSSDQHGVFMASNGQLLPIMGATPHQLIILSFLLTVRTQYWAELAGMQRSPRCFQGESRAGAGAGGAGGVESENKYNQALPPSYHGEDIPAPLCLSAQIINILYRSGQLLRLRLPGQHGTIPGLSRQYCSYQTWIPRSVGSLCLAVRTS